MIGIISNIGLWIITTSWSKIDGTIDQSENDFSNNLLDAMRHAYVSGVFTMEYGEDVANAFGRLNELIPFLSQGRDSKDINMDLWNNAIGRKYPKNALVWLGRLLMED